MPFNFITLWKSEMKLKSFINCKSTCIYTITQSCLIRVWGGDKKEKQGCQGWTEGFISHQP